MKATVSIRPGYCKSCGICIAFCPKGVLDMGERGKAEVVKPEVCIGCKLCETHCPDFAIQVKEVEA